MKLAVFAFVTLASFNVSANDNGEARMNFLRQLTQQAQPMDPAKNTGHNGGDRSCKPAGAQCGMHSECCSNFCGRGQC